jgi:hypothetical protein
MKLPHATRRQRRQNRFRVARVASSVRFPAGCGAAELLNINQHTVRNMIERGKPLVRMNLDTAAHPTIRHWSPEAWPVSNDDHGALSSEAHNRIPSDHDDRGQDSQPPPAPSPPGSRDAGSCFGRRKRRGEFGSSGQTMKAP